MKVMIREYTDNHHNVQCVTCSRRATFVVTTATGDRVRCCDVHVGPQAAALARYA